MDLILALLKTMGVLPVTSLGFGSGLLCWFESLNVGLSCPLNVPMVQIRFGHTGFYGKLIAFSLPSSQRASFHLFSM